MRGFEGLNQRELLMARCLAHIAPMVCFRVMVGEVPEGQKVADCACISCSASDTLYNIFGDARAALMVDTIQREKHPEVK